MFNSASFGHLIQIRSQQFLCSLKLLIFFWSTILSFTLSRYNTQLFSAIKCCWGITSRLNKVSNHSRINCSTKKKKLMLMWYWQNPVFVKHLNIKKINLLHIFCIVIVQFCNYINRNDLLSLSLQRPRDLSVSPTACFCHSPSQLPRFPWRQNHRQVLNSEGFIWLWIFLFGGWLSQDIKEWQ